MGEEEYDKFNEYVRKNGLRKYSGGALAHYVCMMEHEAEVSLMAKGITEPTKEQYRAAVRDTFKNCPQGNYPEMADPFAYQAIKTPVPDAVVAEFMKGYDRGFDLENDEDWRVIGDYISSSSTM